MAERDLVDDLADVLASVVVGWESVLSVDLAQHPEVVRVMARYRDAKAARRSAITEADITWLPADLEALIARQTWHPATEAPPDENVLVWFSDRIPEIMWGPMLKHCTNVTRWNLLPKGPS